jgi:hypothetical protein
MSARKDAATHARRIRQLVKESDRVRRTGAAMSRAMEPTLREAFDEDLPREPHHLQRAESQDHADERNTRVTEIMRRARQHLDAAHRVKRRKVRDGATSPVYKAR